MCTLLLSNTDGPQKVENYVSLHMTIEKRLNVFAGLTYQFLITKTAALNASTERFKTMGCDCSSQISYKGKVILVFVESM